MDAILPRKYTRRRPYALHKMLLSVSILCTCFTFYTMLIIADTNKLEDATTIFAEEKDYRQTAIESSKGAAACLIIKDDNPKLIEWLAYHYQVLPLRHLVITSDPSSRTSPTEILDRWRRTISDLTITEWREEDYGYSPFQTEYFVKEENDPRKKAEQRLISRQYAFYGKCATFLKTRNHNSWVFNIDTDEFVVFNSAHNDDPINAEEEAKNFQRMVHYLKSDKNSTLGLPPAMAYSRLGLYKKAKRRRKLTQRKDFLHEESVLRIIRESLPKIGESTILNYVETLSSSTSIEVKQTVTPCIIIPRLWISSVEEDSLMANTLHGLDIRSFDTLRYFRHAERGGFLFNTYGKPMFDLSRVSLDDLLPVHIHRGPSNVCRNEGAFIDVFYTTSLFRIQHYAGSFKSYFRTDDDRRHVERNKFMVASNIDKGALYDIRPWLEAFVKNVGNSKARKLLSGVGTYSNDVYQPA